MEKGVNKDKMENRLKVPRAQESDTAVVWL